MPPFVEPVVEVPEKSAHADRRHPLYIGDWERSIPYVDETFAKDDLDEPHFKRKRAILEKHPEIEELYGIDKSTKWITFATVSAHLFCAYLFGRVLLDWNWTMVICSYAVGGTLTQAFGSIIHECCHALAHESLFVNRLLGLFVNIGIPVPIAQSFRRYHLEHHTFQGVLGKDPDLPLDWEVTLISGNAFLKFLWLLIFPVMYVVRGAAMGKNPSFWEIVNIIFTIITDICIWFVCGPRGFLYMMLSLWWGYSINPAAAHFIQEHYTWDDGQETYSYYGSMNKLTLNIGFHNEHHDFTKVAWSKLPAIREIAPEFYNTIHYHDSWFRVLWEFVTQPTFGPQSRVGREYSDHLKARKLVKTEKTQ
ncbi:hypothetical protein K493DRAFT_407674 [Basidiobolus meristosporus CBS 931.73]|uniref:Sphingolipid delta4-desaturase N-terminal domain-containing protein n=1 Tax=Basidiobolus meristosporus CBS 931.73 TaxID=1314790 RepID=A0A1Y1YB48_9FUNG|nr:hypothetical protein K493DRAFT_407674 [Basidiobolus meristosporus CBS 931.73]|eukprot:ORX95271.1 hypothetical protein K493DRAFT_407674 [Basidiobolus meristosporus CBS 931.73]